MKKISFTLLLFSLYLLTFAQVSLNIEGSTRAEFEGRPVLILFMDVKGDGIVQVETSIIRNGRFQFKGEINAVDIFNVKAINDLFVVSLDNYPHTDDKYYTEVFLEEGNISVILDTVTNISGTSNNDMLQTYFDIARKPFSKTHVNFIKNNIDNFLAPLAFRAYYQAFSDDDVNDILAVAGEDFKNNEDIDMCIQSREIIKSIGQEGKKRDQIRGTKCPDFEMKTSKGEEVRLYDYISKSKYTVIDFWASWCGPCIASMPHMKMLSEKYKEKGVEIIGVSLDTEDLKQAWLSAVKRINVPWIQLSDLKGTKSELSTSFAVSDVPYTVIVNQEGAIMDCVRLPVKYLEPALERLP